MNTSTHGQQHNGGQGEEKRLGHQEKNPRRGPDWRHVHHHWYFWVGVVLMLVAMGTYVMTEDLSWRPRVRRTDTGHRSSNAVTQLRLGLTDLRRLRCEYLTSAEDVRRVVFSRSLTRIVTTTQKNSS